MPDSPHTQRDLARRHVEALIRRGHELQQASADAPAASRVEDIRAWQQQCAAAINHLSGGSKAHWLSRAFSDAFLVRSIDGAAVVHAPAEEIARRLVEVLSQARASLLQMGDIADGIADAPLKPSRSGDESTAAPQRFAFVHRRELQPILERTFEDSRDAFDRGDFGLALVLACGVLEAIITDALEHAGPRRESDEVSRLAEMRFDARIAAAERAGLIRGGCARLPPIALGYRDLLDDGGALRGDAIVIGRDARLASQVLRIVMRDLDPGR
jgi:hypothetical protein